MSTRIGHIRLHANFDTLIGIYAGRLVATAGSGAGTSCVTGFGSLIASRVDVEYSHGPAILMAIKNGAVTAMRENRVAIFSR